MGAQQYLRACKLTVGGGSGSIDLSTLRVRFDTHQFTRSAPHHANIYVYNLTRSTIEKLRTEYKQVQLEAGYESGAGTIFRGEILQVRTYRENTTDTATHILARTNEKARNFAVANKTLSAGHTNNDRVMAAAQAMQKLGVDIGHIDDLGPKKFSRGFACFGNAKDILRDTCTARVADWFITNGKLNVLKTTNTLPGDVIVLNSKTGMVGLPRQTLAGVEVTCLLNYRIVPGQKLQINESSIQRAAFNPGFGADANQGNILLGDGQILGVAADGIYKSLLVEHLGDNRGEPWYTNIVCVANQGGESPVLRSQGISDDISAPSAGANGTAG